MIKNMNYKILLIEDEPDIHDLIQYELGSNFQVTSAYSLQEAEEKLINYNWYDAIVVDGCVPGNILNTRPLILKLKKEGYKKPIISISSYPEYRKKMLEYGCNYESSKKDVAKLVKSIL